MDFIRISTRTTIFFQNLLVFFSQGSKTRILYGFLLARSIFSLNMASNTVLVNAAKKTFWPKLRVKVGTKYDGVYCVRLRRGGGYYYNSVGLSGAEVQPY